jgi:hypothetical protein
MNAVAWFLAGLLVGTTLWAFADLACEAVPRFMQ